MSSQEASGFMQLLLAEIQWPMLCRMLEQMIIKIPSGLDFYEYKKKKGEEKAVFLPLFCKVGNGST